MLTEHRLSCDNAQKLDATFCFTVTDEKLQLPGISRARAKNTAPWFMYLFRENPHREAT